MVDMRKKRELTQGDFELMGLPKEYWGASWSFLPQGSRMKERVYNYLVSLNGDHKIIHEGDGLFLFGPQGSSKTYIAAICAKAFRKYEYRVMFTTASKFQQDCENKAEFEEGESILDRAGSVDVLVIDDFGKETVGYGKPNYILEMIDFRRDWKKILIVTSRLEPLDIDKKYGGGSRDLSEKIKSFMLGLLCDGSFYKEKQDQIQNKY